MEMIDDRIGNPSYFICSEDSQFQVNGRKLEMEHPDSPSWLECTYYRRSTRSTAVDMKYKLTFS